MGLHSGMDNPSYRLYEDSACTCGYKKHKESVSQRKAILLLNITQNVNQEESESTIRATTVHKWSSNCMKMIE